MDWDALWFSKGMKMWILNQLCCGMGYSHLEKISGGTPPPLQAWMALKSILCSNVYLMKWIWFKFEISFCEVETCVHDRILIYPEKKYQMFFDTCLSTGDV